MKFIVRNESDVPENMATLTFENKGRNTINANVVPTLVPEAVMNILTSGDNEPFFKVESIAFPVKGTGGVYEKEFFKSFVNVMKERPIPGSKRGHEFTSRPASDFYTVGGMITDNADGKGGVAHFKIYIPPKGDPTDNAGFIRDAKANMVHFSLVSAPEYYVKKDENGFDERHFTKSKGYERNDAVEYGAGAMKQEVNAKSEKLLTKSYDHAVSLINEGKVNGSSKWVFLSSDSDKLLGSDGKDWNNYKLFHMIEDTSASEETKERYKYPYGKDGKVYRSALRAIASRAAQSGLTELSDKASELIKLIDDKRKNGGIPVDKEELFLAIKNMMDNRQTSLLEIAKNCGLEGLVRTDSDDANAKTVKALNDKLGENPLARIDAIVAENKANAERTVETKIVGMAGDRMVKNAEGKDVENPAFKYAFTMCNGKSGDALDAAITALKDDPVMRALNAARADGDSNLNRSTGGTKPTEAAPVMNA